MKPLTPGDVVECIVSAKLKAIEACEPSKQKMIEDLFASVLPSIMIEVKRFYSGFETEADTQELGKLMREKGV